ncbi:hypothetical protein DRF58_03970 [Epilithonimonas hispanica]|uniref:Uncharacterized protein n=1 Tax=Epilithonimonas hispanica TaxID=358687 RepID=A0A3D9D266_9FLAO|nr:hypothetical protein DRF58_03970 [Epilithonimonas hispanica]
MHAINVLSEKNNGAKIQILVDSFQLMVVSFWACPFPRLSPKLGSGYPLQSFLFCKQKRISSTIPHALAIRYSQRLYLKQFIFIIFTSLKFEK